MLVYTQTQRDRVSINREELMIPDSSISGSLDLKVIKMKREKERKEKKRKANESKEDDVTSFYFYSCNKSVQCTRQTTYSTYIHTSHRLLDYYLKQKQKEEVDEKRNRHTHTQRKSK